MNNLNLTILKSILAAVFVAASANGAGAGAKPTHVRVDNDQVIYDAAKHIQTEGVGAGVAYLRANIRPEPGVGGADVTESRALLTLACTLHNAGFRAVAQQVAAQLLQSSRSAISNKTGVPMGRRVEIADAAGTVCEVVMGDLDAAKAYYTEAVAISPGDSVAARRLKAVSQKIDLRDARK